MGLVMMETYERLEKTWGELVGRTETTVVCATGTAALHLALEAFSFPLGAEVIVPEYTMVACARAVTMAGLKPVFVDCNSDLLINPNLIMKKITSKTVAIMPVHIYGRRCAMDQIIEIANEKNLRVIEDCSEYHGGILHPSSDACCWSYYKNKIVAGEEGGVISFAVADSENKATNYAKCLRSHGFGPNQDPYHIPRGLSARMSNHHATLILDSLNKLTENLVARKQVEGWYNEMMPTALRMPSRDVVWVYDVRLPARSDQRRIVRSLNQQGIPARYGFLPVSCQPEYRDVLLDTSRLKAFQASQQIIYLPVQPEMTHQTVQETTETLINLL